MTFTQKGQGGIALEQCIEDCIECHRACVRCASHCLDMGGEHAGREHQGLLHDCAQICITAANFMLRDSAHHGAVCGACAELCAACETECRDMSGEDEVMRLCADVCHKCRLSCQEMAGGA